MIREIFGGARGVAIAALACVGICGSAQALVGASEENSSLEPYVVMVLKRAASGAGFCTGIVVARDAVLTAAHCVARLDDTRVHFHEAAGQPMLKLVIAIAVHPQYRANAPKTRERSIDLALVRTAAPLPDRFRPVSIDSAHPIAVGAHFRIAGYGVTREGWGDTAGVLRSGTLAARAPLSNILLWAEDPLKKGFGACEGDSGAPIFAEDSDTLIAVTDWAEGERGTACGKLTQGALTGPQRAWIEGVLAGWKTR